MFDAVTFRHSLNFDQGWVVLGGKTRVHNPHANFHNAFAGSSHSSNDVSTYTRSVWENIQ